MFFKAKTSKKNSGSTPQELTSTGCRGAAHLLGDEGDTRAPVPHQPPPPPSSDHERHRRTHRLPFSGQGAAESRRQTPAERGGPSRQVTTGGVGGRPDRPRPPHPLPPAPRRGLPPGKKTTPTQSSCC